MPRTKKDSQPQFPARVAAEVILVDEGRPMHYREIGKTMLERGIVKVKKGASEEATIKTVRSYLAGCTAEGVRFKRLDPGVFDVKNRKQAEARVRKLREKQEVAQAA